MTTLSTRGGFLVGVVAAAAAPLAAWAVGRPDLATAGLVLAALAAGLVGALTTTGGALAAGLLCWATDDGFALHRFGTLQLGGPDLRALAVAVGVALVARAAVYAFRSTQTSQPAPATAAIPPTTIEPTAISITPSARTTAEPRACRKGATTPRMPTNGTDRTSPLRGA